jgi:hypothetical protein
MRALLMVSCLRIERQHTFCSTFPHSTKSISVERTQSDIKRSESITWQSLVAHRIGYLWNNVDSIDLISKDVIFWAFWSSHMRLMKNKVKMRSHHVDQLSRISESLLKCFDDDKKWWRLRGIKKMGRIGSSNSIELDQALKLRRKLFECGEMSEAISFKPEPRASPISQPAR